ncbi:hypothetical protein EPO34_03310 [Patescibacteria group bacterium]|nr:MAG: hypothetical protein EPO34_03310 [Patescibacteria group bacterium]
MGKKNKQNDGNQNKDLDVALGKKWFPDLSKPLDLGVKVGAKKLGEEFRQQLPHLVQDLKEMGLSGGPLTKKLTDITLKLPSLEVAVEVIAALLADAAYALPLDKEFGPGLISQLVKKFSLQTLSEGLSALDAAKARPIKDVNETPSSGDSVLDAKTKVVAKRETLEGPIAITLDGVFHAVQLDGDGNVAVDSKKDPVLLCEVGSLLQANAKDFTKNLRFVSAKAAAAIGGSAVCKHCEPEVARRIADEAKKAAAPAEGEAKPGERKEIDGNVIAIAIAYGSAAHRSPDLFKQIEGHGYLDEVMNLPSEVAAALVENDVFDDDGELTDKGFDDVTAAIRAFAKGRQELANKAGLGAVTVVNFVGGLLKKEDEEPAAVVVEKPDLSGALATALEARAEEDPQKRAEMFLAVAEAQAKAGEDTKAAFDAALGSVFKIKSLRKQAFMCLRIGQTQAKVGKNPTNSFDWARTVADGLKPANPPSTDPQALQKAVDLAERHRKRLMALIGKAHDEAFEVAKKSAVQPPPPPPPPPKKGRARRFIEAVPKVLWAYAIPLAAAVVVTVLGAMGGGFVGAAFSLLAGIVGVVLTAPVATLLQEMLDRTDQGLNYKDDTPGTITKFRNLVMLGLVVLGIGTAYAAVLEWMDPGAKYPFGMRLALTLGVMGLYVAHWAQMSNAEQVLRKARGEDGKEDESKLSSIDRIWVSLMKRSALLCYWLIPTVVVAALVWTLYQSSTHLQDVLRGLWYGVQVNAAFLVAVAILVVVAAAAFAAWYRFKDHKFAWIPVTGVSVVLAAAVVGSFFVKGSEMTVTTPDGKTKTIPGFGGNTAPDFSTFAPISKDRYEAAKKVRADVTTVVVTAADALAEQATAEIGSMKDLANKKREVEALRAGVETDEEKAKLLRRKEISARILAIPAEIVDAEGKAEGLKEMSKQKGISISEREEFERQGTAAKADVTKLKAELKALQGELAELKGEKKPTTVADKGASNGNGNGGGGHGKTASNDKPKKTDKCAKAAKYGLSAERMKLLGCTG